MICLFLFRRCLFTYYPYFITATNPPRGRHDISILSFDNWMFSSMAKLLSSTPSLNTSIVFPSTCRGVNEKERVLFSLVPFNPPIYQTSSLRRASTISVPGYPLSNFVSSQVVGNPERNSLTCRGS